VTRVDVGGKLLTNHLKEIISYRQIHVLEETYVMNACKEDACFVSLDFNHDLKISDEDTKIRIKKNAPADSQSVFKTARDYVLPDFTSLRRGFLKSAEETGRPADGEQTIRLNNERFMVPELLFHPSDVGIQQVRKADQGFLLINLN
jgi:actin-related protein 6